MISVTVPGPDQQRQRAFVDERQPGVISGTVREDRTTTTLGDTRIGVTVVLKDATGLVATTTTTDATFNYVFNNVRAGSTVEETNKLATTDVSDIDGGNPRQRDPDHPGQSSTGNDLCWTSARPPSATASGKTPTSTACRTPAKPALLASPSSLDAERRPWWPPPPPTPTATTASPSPRHLLGRRATAGRLRGHHPGTWGNDDRQRHLNGTGQSGQRDELRQNNPTVDAGLYRAGRTGRPRMARHQRQRPAGQRRSRRLRRQGDPCSTPPATRVTSTTTDAAATTCHSASPAPTAVQFDKTTLPAGYASPPRQRRHRRDRQRRRHVTDGKTVQTVLDSGESDRSWDAGIMASPGAITGTVLEDTNNDNVGDTPAGRRHRGARRTRSPAPSSPTTTTDANGNHAFTGVPRATHVVKRPTSRATPTSPTRTAATPTASPSRSPRAPPTAGNNFIDERPPGAISGTVREDLDNNDTGDTPIAGVTVTLKDATTGPGRGHHHHRRQRQPPSPACRPAATPSSRPTSWLQPTSPTSTAATPTDQRDLTQGQSSTGNDFVDERPATLGDRVWLDTNANGVRDAGEAGIAGVTVVLKDAAGALSAPPPPTATATTASPSPRHLPVAVWRRPATWSPPRPGGNEATDSDM